MRTTRWQLLNSRAPLSVVSLLLLVLLGVVACDPSDEVEVVDWRADATRLVQRGLSDPDPWVRAETVRLLGLSRDVLLLEHVRAALDDPHSLVQTSALEALIRIGSSSAEDAILAMLIRGSLEQKVQLLDLVFQHGGTGLQRNAVRRALRDVDPVVRRSALERMTSRSIAVDAQEIQRLLADSNVDVSLAAFRNLATTDPDLATDETLRRMRSDDSGQREQGLRFAVALGSPDVWASMRSFLQLGNERERAVATLALGTIGDPLVEESLRQTVLSGNAEDAAAALRALGRIPTVRAREQAGRHRRDPRLEVRRVAFEVMRALSYPTADFEPHIEDADPWIGAQVLDELRARDPHHAALLLARTLQSGAEPVHVLAALHTKAQTHDISDLLAAARPQLEQLAASADDDAAALGTRLLLRYHATPADLDRAMTFQRPAALFAATEAAIVARDPGYSHLFAHALDHDLFFVRVAGAIGILTLGDGWEPPAPDAPA